MTKLITVSFYGKNNMTGGSERFFDQFKSIAETEHVDYPRAGVALYGPEALKINQTFRFFEVEGGIVIDQFLTMFEDLYKPDLIIRNSWSGGYIKPKTPVISVFQDVHHTAAEILKDNLFYNPVEYNRISLVWTDLQKKVAEQSVCRVAVSEFVKEKMKEIGIEIDKVIYHGIDLNHFKPLNKKEELRKKYNVPLDKKVGLWIGRFHPQKGWHIMSELIKNFPDVFWICVFMEPIKHGPQLKNVVCLRHLPYEVMPEIYNLADFFILPSCCESFGLSSLEACACGIPIISQNTGWLWDLQNIDCHIEGIIIDNWNYESYADAVKKMITEENHYEPRKIAEMFPIEKWREEWRETIEEVKRKCSEE